MSVREWYMNRMVRRMSAGEKRDMMGAMMDRFLESMSAGERSALMSEMMPRMMDRMFEGMTAEQRVGLMSAMMPAMMDRMFEGTTAGNRMEMMASMMPLMMARIFGGGKEGEGDLPGAMKSGMPCMQGREGKDAEGAGGFRPWEFCPCRELCARVWRGDGSTNGNREV